MQIPILGSLGSNIFGPNHNMLQFGESSAVELPFDPNDIDGLIQYLFKPGTSQPYEDPAIPNRWLVPDDRPGTGTGLAVDGAAVQPDGVDDNVIVTGIGTTGTSWSVSGWFKSTQTGTSKFLFNQQSGGLILAWCGDVANQIAINTGLWHSFGATPNDGNWHYLTFVFAGATGRCFLDGVQLGTDAVISPMTLSAASTTRLFSSYAASVGFWTGTASQIRIDDTALTLAQHTAAMSGDPADPDYPPNATCLRYWSCEDYHNTLLLDSSGNGGHGTKTNSTTGRGSGTFHYQGSNVPFDSLVARRGYTLDGTHGVIPARLTGSLDALGNSLQYTGPLKRPGQLKQSYCLKFNGTTEYVQFNQSLWADYVSVNVSCSGRLRFRMADVSTSQTLVAAMHSSTDRFSVSVVSGHLRITYYNGASASKSQPIESDKDYVLEWVYTAGTHSLSATVNGVECTSTLGASLASGTQFIAGARTTSGSFPMSNALLSELTITGGPSLTFSEGAGVTVYDNSGLGLHGTIFNATTTLGAGIRAGLTDAVHGNLMNGYSLIEHDTADPILVPYVNGSPYSGAYPAGYSLTRHNPAGAKHNGCETKINFTGGVASPGSSGLETAWSFNTARTNPRFKRNLTSSGSPVAVDKMYAYLSALSGSDLTNVQTDTADTSA